MMIDVITRWHGVPVLPRSRRVLEAPLRSLAPAAWSGDEMVIDMIALMKKMERSAGLAPASPDWRTGILLLNDDRISAARTSCERPRRD
jgi:hypothetical protein